MSVRLRLTALYTALFGASGAVLVGASAWLVHRHVERTLPPGLADEALRTLDLQLALALAGTLVLAVALGWVAAGRALAPLDALLDRLAAAYDGQRRFVANASHELRTPLTVIRAEADVALADPGATQEDLRAMGEAVLQATDRTQELLDSLMVLARSQQALPRREALDLATAARAATAQVGPEATERGVRVRLDVRPAPLEADRPLVERLVANLVENAVRHNEPGGRVDVLTRPGLVRVENTGRVVSPEDVRRLAEPFERLNRDCDGPGAGLGLSIVRSVADAHGARLGLRPRAGGGLVAEVAFPSDAVAGRRGPAVAAAVERRRDADRVALELAGDRR